MDQRVVQCTCSWHATDDFALNGVVPSNVVTFNYDVVPPRVRFYTDMPLDSNQFNQKPVFFELNEAVVEAINASYVVYIGANMTQFAAVAGSDGMQFQLVFKPYADKVTITVTIPAGVWHDAAGNGNLASGITSDFTDYDVVFQYTYTYIVRRGPWVLSRG